MAGFHDCLSSHLNSKTRETKMSRVAILTLVILLAGWLPANADPSTSGYAYK